MGRREGIYVRVEQLSLLSTNGAGAGGRRSCSDGSKVRLGFYLHFLVKLLCSCRTQRAASIPCVSKERALCNVSHGGFAEVPCP